MYCALMPDPSFADRLINWQRQHGRHDLPWQNTQDAYRIWLSEIMLQQTQVASVMAYYPRFLARFPTLAELAAAPVEEVMTLWSGLGYYARARNLHRCAQTIVHQYDGQFPQDPAALRALPGIGRSTANAIAVFSFGVRAPILDGNVKRVLCRVYAIEEFPGTAAIEQQLWQLAHTLLPNHATDCATYIQAQMDLGANLCSRTRPDCPRCPLAGLCIAYRDGRTHELPRARPRKALPQRAVQVLLLHDGHDRWLFERRPPSGIWGGLLSLPETESGAGTAAAETAADLLGTGAEPLTPLATLRHNFTHFQLTLQPLTGKRPPQTQIADSSRYHWLTRDEALAAALPTPIRRIIVSAWAQENGQI